MATYAVYLADLNPTVGGEIRKVRPVVGVSRNEMNQFLDTVVVCPLTSVLHPPAWTATDTLRGERR